MHDRLSDGRKDSSADNRRRLYARMRRRASIISNEAAQATSQKISSVSSQVANHYLGQAATMHTAAGVLLKVMVERGITCWRTRSDSHCFAGRQIGRRLDLRTTILITQRGSVPNPKLQADLGDQRAD